MSARILKFTFRPYADLSQLTSFGRRLQKRPRHKLWLLQEDGSYLLVKVPGPGTVSPLRLRSGPISSIRDFPQAVTPPRVSRGQVQSRAPLARQLSAKKGQVPPQWSEVFVAASEDERYVSREICHPAVGFLARGHCKDIVQRVSEDLPPMKKIKKQDRQAGAEKEGHGRRQVSVLPLGETLKRRRLQNTVSRKSNSCLHGSLRLKNTETACHIRAEVGTRSHEGPPNECSGNVIGGEEAKRPSRPQLPLSIR